MNERKKPMKTTLLVIAATLTVATSVLGVIGDTREKLIAGAGDIVVKELNVPGGYHILQTVFDDRVEIAILIEGKSEAEFIEFPNKETFERSTQTYLPFLVLLYGGQPAGSQAAFASDRWAQIRDYKALVVVRPDKKLQIEITDPASGTYRIGVISSKGVRVLGTSWIYKRK